VTTSSKAVRLRESSKRNQLFNLGLIQSMQHLVVLLLTGTVEFPQEIEPKLGDVAKNPVRRLSRGVQAHEFFPFQAIQRPCYTRCLSITPLCAGSVGSPPRPAPRRMRRDVVLCQVMPVSETG